MRWRCWLWAAWAVALAMGVGLALPCRAQAVQYTLLGGALVGSPSGFVLGAGLNFQVAHNVSFEPTVAAGRTGSQGLWTLDGSFLYTFHPDDEAFIPYVLGGLGMSQWGGATHGSPLVGAGLRIPIGNETWIRPEIRVGAHGLSRFTIGWDKSF